MEYALALLAAILLILALSGQGKRGIGSLPVRAAPLMTKRERAVCAFIERAIPEARVHAQVSMGAILRPAAGLDRSRSTTVRNRFSSKRIDFLLEDRASGTIIAIVELDDRTHNARQDAERDRMTARAGYTTIRLPAGQHTALSVRQTLLEALSPHPPIPTASRRSAARA
ncbi:DUF2726 domain-containing protein [Croceicoccus marinus]|uniref:DUF2726 domain-containing protein n=1 Tax=Croceicoccus marinus TaxID=450378 RepID=A0A7G6W148_9SPHN|nr:DUF2726 domain-containing protein [Croceicoccus marinus]QNE07713.1 DUF2726 domain-containing protein [Croceicoccus marinus]